MKVMRALRTGLVCLGLLVLIACGSENSALVEQREVTAGEYNGLVIGADKDHTLEAVKALGAQVISATPCDPFRVALGSSDSLSLGNLEGIRVTDPKSHFEDIYFKDGKVLRRTHTPGTELVAGIADGDDVEAVGKKLTTGGSTEGLTATPIVDMQNGGVVTLSGSESVPANTLGSHNCWRFEINSVAPAGAVYEIDFGQTGLKRILYRRARVRTE
jgi:hypothetical protein